MLFFRSTDQIKLRDIRTDAKPCLQRLEPSDDHIIVNVTRKQTVDLANFLRDSILFKALSPKDSEAIPSGASTFHFGFLQARVRVRMTQRYEVEDVLGCMDIEKQSQADISVTGHSLRGALATLAGSEFQVHCLPTI